MASKKKNIYVNGIDQVPVPMRQIEIVERKGVGHPDSVADNIAETVSQALCRMYKGEVGHVLHPKRCGNPPHGHVGQTKRP